MNAKLLPPGDAPSLSRTSARLTAALYNRLDALLLLVAAESVRRLTDLPSGTLLAREHGRLKRPPGSCYSFTLPTRRGLRVVIGVLADAADAFQTLSLAARIVKEISPAQPAAAALGWLGHEKPDATQPLEALLTAVLTAIEAQPTQKSKPAPRWRPKSIVVCGRIDLESVRAVHGGSHLARWLTQLPPNVLGPAAYRRSVAALARRHGWRMRVYGEAALKRLGAGAFVAVAAGSANRDAALVHLQYRPRARGGGTRAPIALVGKGLCFDTGGLNIKTPKGMLDMHADMAGSAVALGILAALTKCGYPHPVDAWLALAENRIGPHSYTQQDIVTAANGTTIQVVHTDAEGRMVLADTLAIASRTRPACIIDFATLTGACVTALTERLSGVFTNRPGLRDHLEGAGRVSGERVWNLPMPSDFDDDLESPVADTVQCLIDGKGDHIYAARFLSKFVAPAIPWIHVDLSSAERSGGLAHVPTPITGFGVRFGTTLLSDPDFLAALSSPGHPT